MKRLNSRWLVPFILLMLLSIAVGLPAADDILIGGALSLTGVQAPLDEPGLRGANVAVKALNDSGGLLGKKVRFINLDGKSDPVTVGNIAIDLIDRGAKFIVAPCDFDFGGPASREAQKKDIIGISTCASDPLYSSWSLGDKQFTLSMWNTTMGATAAEYAFKERGWKTAYVVTDQFIAYTKSLSKYFVEHFKAIGGTILGEDTYTQGDQDFSAQLARLKALKKQPDVIFISSYMPDLGTIIRSIRKSASHRRSWGETPMTILVYGRPWARNSVTIFTSSPILGWERMPSLKLKNLLHSTKKCMARRRIPRLSPPVGIPSCCGRTL